MIKYDDNAEWWMTKQTWMNQQNVNRETIQINFFEKKIKFSI